MKIFSHNLQKLEQILAHVPCYCFEIGSFYLVDQALKTLEPTDGGFERYASPTHVLERS